MEPLENIYKDNFFKGRHRYIWRAKFICAALIGIYNPKMVIDAGCAIGTYIDELLNRGINAYGIEGSIKAIPYLVAPKNRIIFADLRVPVTEEMKEQITKFDLLISLEVAEHIEPEYADVFLDNLTIHSDHILMTAALPGVAGKHHINCQLPEYWVAKMAQRGYKRMPEYEKRFKEFLEPWKRRTAVKHYYNHVLCFDREPT